MLGLNQNQTTETERSRRSQEVSDRNIASVTEPVVVIEAGCPLRRPRVLIKPDRGGRGKPKTSLGYLTIVLSRNPGGYYSEMIKQTRPIDSFDASGGRFGS